MTSILDYGTLKFIWWIIVCVLFVGFAIMDGQDMGVGSLLPFIGRTDEERRVIINSVASHWEGNQVWLILAGGAIFAAFPLIYATSFSAFYWAMLLALWALFLRPVGFDYRSKIKNPLWRKSWDWGIFIGSFIPPIVFGIAIGNLLQGIPFYFNGQMLSFYTGSFLELLNPFALLCGAIGVMILIFHGGIYLMLRTVDEIYYRTYTVIKIIGILILILFSVSGLLIAYYIDGYKIISGINISDLSIPLNKQVIKDSGLWLSNYHTYPWLIVIPILAYIGILCAIYFGKYQHTLVAFIFSSIGTASIILTVAVSMFPFILPSSYGKYNSSLTVWDSTSSQFTLCIMLIATVIFMPIVLTYTRWAYGVLGGKITTSYIKENDKNLY